MEKEKVQYSEGKKKKDKRKKEKMKKTNEGKYMKGVLKGQWKFSAYIDPDAPTSLEWLY